MSKFKFELNYGGVRKLLKSEEMQDVITNYTQKVYNKLPVGYEMGNSYNTKTRAKNIIETVSDEAIIDNSANNTLLKAIGGN